MHLLKLSLLFVSLAVLRALAAPVPPSGSSGSGSSGHGSVQHNRGDFVGVRAPAYEKKTKAHAKIDIHPGVIVDHNPKTGEYGVAMISKTLPHNPPQEPITHFHVAAGSSVYGNIALSPPKQVMSGAMKPWKNGHTGLVEAPMSSSNLNRLDKAMAPHAGWEAPKTPTPPPSPELPVPQTKGQKAGKGSKGGRAPPPLSGGHPPNPHWRAPHPNAVASSSRSSNSRDAPSAMYQQGARYPPHPNPNQGRQRSPTGPPNAYRPAGPNQAAYRSNIHPAPNRSNNNAQPVGNPPVNPLPNRLPPAGAYPPINPAGYHPGPLPASSHPGPYHSAAQPGPLPGSSHLGPYHPAAHPPTHPTDFHPSGYPAAANPGGYPAAPSAMGHPGPHPAYKPSGSSQHPSNIKGGDNSRRPSGKPRDRSSSPDWRARKDSKGKKPDYSKRPPVVRRSLQYARRLIRSQ